MSASPRVGGSVVDAGVESADYLDYPYSARTDMPTSRMRCWAIAKNSTKGLDTVVVGVGVGGDLLVAVAFEYTRCPTLLRHRIVTRCSCSRWRHGQRHSDIESASTR